MFTWDCCARVSSTRAAVAASNNLSQRSDHCWKKQKHVRPRTSVSIDGGEHAYRGARDGAGGQGAGVIFMHSHRTCTMKTNQNTRMFLRLANTPPIPILFHISVLAVVFFRFRRGCCSALVSEKATLFYPSLVFCSIPAAVAVAAPAQQAKITQVTLAKFFRSQEASNEKSDLRFLRSPSSQGRFHLTKDLHFTRWPRGGGCLTRQAAAFSHRAQNKLHTSGKKGGRESCCTLPPPP